MSIENNKKIILEFWKNFSAGDVEKALDCLHEDAIWRAMGVEGDLPVSGEMDREGAANLINVVQEAFPNGMELKHLDWIAEGNKVAQEMESYGVFEAKGKVYKNLYHFLYEFKDGKIFRIKEYMDTLHVKDVFLD